jgi:DNA-binding beta-propeller fold protein YncE
MRYFQRISLIMTLFVLLTGVAFAGNDNIINKNAAKVFATLPDGVAFPEGITANPQSGEIYVSTFNLDGNNKLLRFGPNGKLLAQIDFGGTPLLGLAFNSIDGKVYIANFGASMIQRIPHDFSSSTPIENVADIPIIGAPPNRTVVNPDDSEDVIMFGNNFPAPNGLVFSSEYDLFVSDSFQGAIFKIDDAAYCTAPCPVETVKHDGLLATAGFPPFGANGLALSKDGATLFITNTGDDRVLRLDLGTNIINVFAESIDGADGIVLDKKGNLWVAANQADQIMVLNEFGQVVTKLGEFLGIRKNDSPRGLLFPASLVIQGKWVFVTNLALPLTTIGGDEPEENIMKYTVSRIKIPANID